MVKRWPAVAVLLTALMLVACGQPPPPAEPGVIGRWMNDDEQTILNIHADGTFTLSLHVEPPDEVTGTYAVGDTDRRIVFHYPPEAPRCANTDGVYVYEIEGVRMLLTKVVDDCPLREIQLTLPWTRLEPAKPKVKSQP